MADEGTQEQMVVEAELDEQFDAGVESPPSSRSPSGIEEALQAWEAGGHAIDEDDADEARPVRFAQLEEPALGKPKTKPNRLNNVLVDITVELGRKEMSVRELTNIKEQDVLALDKLAGEAFDILINKRQFAEGEIVVVTDLMAVRITRLLEPKGSEEEEE